MTLNAQTSTDDLVKFLRKKVVIDVENRKIAEFGPGGGNPDAKLEDHIEWWAARRLEDLEHDNKVLRTLLATCYAGADLYTDDGQLQDNRRQPFIDFGNDSVDEIDCKLMERVKG